MVGIGYSFEGGEPFSISNTGQNYIFQPDLSQLQANLNLLNLSVTAGEVIYFEMSAPVNPSGYSLVRIWSGSEYLDDVNVSLKRPDGQIAATGTMNYENGAINTDPAWAAGAYTLEVSWDLGPLYDHPLLTSASIIIESSGSDYDINDDGETSYADLQAIASSYQKETGETGFQSSADLNQDGVINLFDMVLLARQLPPPPPPPPPPPTPPPASTIEPPAPEIMDGSITVVETTVETITIIFTEEVSETYSTVDSISKDVTVTGTYSIYDYETVSVGKPTM